MISGDTIKLSGSPLHPRHRGRPKRSAQQEASWLLDGKRSGDRGNRQPKPLMVAVHRLNVGGFSDEGNLRYSRPICESRFVGSSSIGIIRQTDGRELGKVYRRSSREYVGKVHRTKRRNGYHFQGRQQARKLPNTDSVR